MSLDELRARDRVFLDKALRKGRLTSVAVDECLRIQVERARQGELVPVRLILRERGYLHPKPLEEGAPATLAAPATPDGEAEGFPGRFGGYSLLEEIARGGMGVVYKARQEGLGRLVALKVLVAGEEATSEQVERFHREASLAAQLRHPNIVPIHEVGVHEGKHFFTMDLVIGETLDEATPRRGMPAARALPITRQICDAVGHAHDRGIVHRDLKPANVMLDERQNAQVMDFGLARQSGRTSGRLTRSGAAVGTPAYMAPEQAAGRVREVDASSDVYGIGALLYQMLTGRPPFTGTSMMNILFAVAHRNPTRPRRLNPQIPREVETICLKAMAKEKERRYPSARAMGEDIGRFLAGLPIEARPPGLFYRLRKLVGRNRAASAAALVVVAALATLLAAGRNRPDPSATRKVEELTSRIETDRRVEDLIGEALRLEANGARPEVVLEKLEATRAVPARGTRALVASGLYLARIGRHRQAAAWFEKTIEREPSNHRAVVQLAFCHQALGDLDRFNRILMSLAGRGLEDEVGWYIKGHGHLRASRWRLAISCYGKSVTLDRRFVQSYKERASCYLKTGDRERARADLLQVIRLDPRDLFALSNLGGIHNRPGELGTALDYFRQGLAASRDDGDRAGFHFGIAVAEWNRQRFQEANKHVLEAIRLQRGNAQFQDLARRIREKLGEGDARRGPMSDTVEGLLARGLQLYRGGRHDEAIVLFDRALAAGGTDEQKARALANRGQCHKAMGRLKEALVDYERALALSRNAPVVLLWRGLARSRLGMKREALEDLDAFLVHRPGDSAALFDKAGLHDDLGELAAARKAYKLCLVRASDRYRFSAHGNLASLEMKAGDLDAALAHAKSALAVRAGDPSTLLVACALSYATERSAPAIDFARQLRGKPGTAPARALVYAFLAQVRLDPRAARAMALPEPPRNLYDVCLLLAAGRMDQEDAKRLTGDAAAFCLARFFQGERALLENRRAQARRHWEEAVKIRLPHVMEYWLARRRLGRPAPNRVEQPRSHGLEDVAAAMRGGDVRRALNLAMTARPTDERMRYWTAVLLYAADRGREAAERFKVLAHGKHAARAQIYLYLCASRIHGTLAKARAEIAALPSSFPGQPHFDQILRMLKTPGGGKITVTADQRASCEVNFFFGELKFWYRDPQLRRQARFFFLRSVAHPFPNSPEYLLARLRLRQLEGS